MKNFTYTILGLLILLASQTNAQNLIAVQNGAAPTFFNTLDLAVTNAQNGDTIYIPGGTFTISKQIGKRLHIIGVGHNPDSTLATGSTQINGDLVINLEASNGSLTGVCLTGTIWSGTNISNYLVLRCRIASLRLTSTTTNWSFIENIMGASSVDFGTGALHCFLSNNIISSASSTYYSSFTSSIFKNNIFLIQTICIPYSGCGVPIIASTSTFENNIFISTEMTCGGISNSAMNNNLFVEDISITSGNIWGANNLVNQARSSIFVNQTGNEFNYSHDYHLQPTSPGKNAGKDGTDVGIYGGAFPWKAGSVPPNPHIRFENVGGIDTAGNLHVKIKVAAQDN